MSVLDYVTIAITRSSFPEGAICRIDYSYYLNSDRAAYFGNTHFLVECEVWAKDLLREKMLAEHRFDKHTVDARDAMPVQRSFLIPCETLNERIGKDHLFLRLFVQAGNGETFFHASPIVNEHF